MKKPLKKVKKFEIKPQPFGGFKIVEYSSQEGCSSIKKRTLYKGLNLSDAESIIYNLETKN